MEVTTEQLQTVLDYAKETKRQAENVISNYTNGSLAAIMVADVRDAADSTIKRVEELLAEPAGSPVPDSGNGQPSTAGQPPAPTEEELAAAGLDKTEGDTSGGEQA